MRRWSIFVSLMLALMFWLVQPVLIATVITTMETGEIVEIIEPAPEPSPDFAPPPPDPDQPSADPYPYLPSPPPEDIVYDPSEPTTAIPYTITDPDTGETIQVEVFNDEISVRFAPEATQEEIDAIIASVGQKKVYMPWIDVWVIKIPPAASQEELDSKLQTLSENPLVEMAVPSIVVSPDSLQEQEIHPNDPYYLSHQLGPNREGHLARIYLPKAWYYERGVPEVRIGIIDTGVRTTHEDIAPKLIVQYPDGTYHGNHGTAVASIAAAATNNGVGIAGVGWNIFIVSGRASTNPDRLNNNLIESRFKDFLRTYPPIFVVNMSYGGPPGPGSPWSDGQKLAMLEAWRREVLLVTAAGNEGAPVIHNRYPAGSAMAMPVGAMYWRRNPQEPDSDDDGYFYFRVGYSNYHEEGRGYLSVMAPGEGIFAASADSGAAYEWFGGTSGAAPHVTGLAALVLSRFPSMSGLDLRHRLEDTADDRVRPHPPEIQPSSYVVGYDRWTGWGRIDARRAVADTIVEEFSLTPNRWHLICLPIWPVRQPNETDWRDSAAAWKVFPSGSRWLYRLIPGTDKYADVSINKPSFEYNPSVELVRPYQSFWVKYEGDASVMVTAEGAAAGVKQDHPLEIRLTSGLNLLGNPFRVPLTWDDQSVRVRHYKVKKRRFLFWRKGVTESIEELPLSAAIKAGWLRDRIALWDPDTGSYFYVDDNVGQSIPPRQGFFLYANRDNLTLILKPTAP